MANKTKKIIYFQFEPGMYLTGSIQFCSLEAQGLYMNICCIYWQRQCQLTVEQLHKKFDQKDLIDELFNENVIKSQKCNVIIDFLVTQLESITNCKLILSEAGRKGGLKSAQARLKAKGNHKIREDKIREDKITVDKKEDLVFPYNSTEFMSVWDALSKEKNWKRKSQTALQAALKKIAEFSKSEEDAIKIMESTIAGEWKGIFPLKNNENGKSTTFKTEREKRGYEIANLKAGSIAFLNRDRSQDPK